MVFLYTAYSFEGSAEGAPNHVSVERAGVSERMAKYLQQFGKKRNKICPFVYTIKGGETFFDLLCILLVFGIRREGCARP